MPIPRCPMVAVVIPNWNGRRFLTACFDALRAQRFRHFEIVLVDNGSRDDSVAFTAAHYPEVRILALPANHGFAAAVNRGIEATGGRYVALLNNDTEADPDWLGELVRALEQDPSAASAATRIRECGAGRRDRLYGLGQALTPDGCPHRIGAGQVDRSQSAAIHEVFGACGGAALYRRAVLEEIEFLDEAFFAYLEDDDWAFRARLAGYACLAVPTAVVYHVGSATTGAGSPLLFRLSTRNRVRLVLKNYPLPLLVRCAPAILASHARLIAASALSRRLRPVLQGYAEALTLLPDTLRERRRVQRLRRVSEAELRAAFSRPEQFIRPLSAVLRVRGTQSAGVGRPESAGAIPCWASPVRREKTE